MTQRSAEEVGAVLLDKNGRKIMVGDVLKVFHFVGARHGRHHFMYKHVLSLTFIGKEPQPCFVIGHLNLNDSEHYFQTLDDRRLQDYEIVQGLDDFLARAITPPTEDEQHA